MSERIWDAMVIVDIVVSAENAIAAPAALALISSLATVTGLVARGLSAHWAAGGWGTPAPFIGNTPVALISRSAPGVDHLGEAKRIDRARAPRSMIATSAHPRRYRCHGRQHRRQRTIRLAGGCALGHVLLQRAIRRTAPARDLRGVRPTPARQD